VGGGDLGTCKQGGHEAGGEGVVHHVDGVDLILLFSEGV
jgi:hypothetical protein